MFLERLELSNILSFGDTTVELGRLNVLIGANAVGKSNLIEAVSLLKAAPTNLAAEMLRGGGVRQWLWLGESGTPPVGSLQCGVKLANGPQTGALDYRLEFSEDASGFLVLAEWLAKPIDDPDRIRRIPYFDRSVTQTEFGGAVLDAMPGAAKTASTPRTDSVLAQFKNPLDSTPITNLGSTFERIRIFRDFRTGIGSPARQGIATTVPKDFLSDSGDNLALVLHELDFQGAHDRIKPYLTRFCERFEDVKVRVGAGIAQTFLRENGLSEALPAVRMSDGTLKFLCLLAVLFNPTPPPLICIEEPELGMHPDAVRLIAEALVEASQSVQLIVTTHSEALIDALSDQPESVLVCERDLSNSTQMRRLSQSHLSEWLEHYTLGQLWRKGELGGGRW
jgi:predicted ATPase